MRKQKPSTKKLALRAETLRHLAADDLARVVGGGGDKAAAGEGARRTAQCNSYIEYK